MVACKKIALSARLKQTLLRDGSDQATEDPTKNARWQ